MHASNKSRQQISKFVIMLLPSNRFAIHLTTYSYKDVQRILTITFSSILAKFSQSKNLFFIVFKTFKKLYVPHFLDYYSRVPTRSTIFLTYQLRQNHLKGDSISVAHYFGGSDIFLNLSLFHRRQPQGRFKYQICKKRLKFRLLEPQTIKTIFSWYENLYTM